MCVCVCGRFVNTWWRFRLHFVLLTLDRGRFSVCVSWTLWFFVVDVVLFVVDVVLCHGRVVDVASCRVVGVVS